MNHQHIPARYRHQPVVPKAISNVIAVSLIAVASVCDRRYSIEQRHQSRRRWLTLR